MYLFDEQWFKDKQRTLLWLLNAPLIKVWFRWVMRIRRCDCPLKTKITELNPNRFSWGDRLITKDGKLVRERTTDFRTHNKFSKRLYFSFLPIWYLCHAWDIFIANIFKPAWNLGFDTLTVYPDAGTGNTTVDGYTMRGGQNQTFANLIAGAGTSAADTEPYIYCALYASVTTNQFSDIWRSLMTFNTAALTSDATISAVVLSLYGSSKYDGLGADALSICASTPANNNAVVAADHSQLGSTSFGNVAYASVSITGYNDVSLDSSGIANVSKTGISRFGTRGGWDIAGSFGGTWRSGYDTTLTFYSADYTGTTRDPKLVITYSLPIVTSGNFFLIF